MLRVGRRVYANGSYTDPSFPDFTLIICLTAKTKYSSLSPYCLFDEEGCNMENGWQFRKVYATVPAVKEREHRYSKRIVWEHPAEQHLSNDEPTAEYWAWREKGMRCADPIRYPVGFAHRHKCLFSLHEGQRLDYIAARKAIYLPLYCKLVQGQAQFGELKERLANGENLLIIEVDGPHQESLSYYKETYGVENDFFVNSTMLCNEANLRLLLDDAKHPFGHGYCLAWALLGLATESQ